MSAPFGFGEEVAVLNDELLRKAVAEQAPESARVYGQEAGAADKDVLMLRIDFQSEWLFCYLFTSTYLPSSSLGLCMLRSILCSATIDENTVFFRTMLCL